jgi:Asp-tRNA(Asn)/Glu-tRNA(Gln) amidotransferase A subunit family amidase
MADLDDLCFLPAVELASAIREREVCPVEVTRAFLERIDRVNPKINAFATADGQEVLHIKRLGGLKNIGKEESQVEIVPIG